MRATFANGVMRIRYGKRTDEPIRHPLPKHWKEGSDYYVKPDPDFKKWTYSRCHRRLRLKAQPGDIIFFRTMWRQKQYFVGYFVIKEKTGDPLDPVLVADPDLSLTISNFKHETTTALIRKLNPNVTTEHVKRYHPNVLALFLGRDYLKINHKKTIFLKNLLDRNSL